jgi:DNA repair exonuclease SbcCD ATPase subunit
MADIKTKFRELTSMKYVDQAKWYLNGFWEQHAQKDAENIWKITQKFIELDTTKKAEGCELDEFLAHKFLESLGETLTVLALRERLRKIDLDCNGKMALLEYLASKFDKSVQEIIVAPQGSNKEKLDEATQKLQAVQDALEELTKQYAEQKQVEEDLKKAEEEQKKALAEQKQALEEQKAAEEKQQKALEEQKKAEDAVRKSEAELRAAVDDLKNQEDSYHNAIKTLETKSNDESASTVAKSKAKAELAQLKQEDPLPLRKAKITQEAALRKVEKERKAAEAATAELEAKTREVEAKTRELEEKTRQTEEKARQTEALARDAEAKTKDVEAAVKDTEDKFREAQEYLEEVKRQGGVAHGAVWWLERELVEAQKYMPKKKQQK